MSSEKDRLKPFPILTEFDLRVHLLDEGLWYPFDTSEFLHKLGNDFRGRVEMPLDGFAYERRYGLGFVTLHFLVHVFMYFPLWGVSDSDEIVESEEESVETISTSWFSWTSCPFFTNQAFLRALAWTSLSDESAFFLCFLLRGAMNTCFRIVI